MIDMEIPPGVWPQNFDFRLWRHQMFDGSG
jgi:hypothetical protein